jgi:hypothetical protein
MFSHGAMMSKVDTRVLTLLGAKSTQGRTGDFDVE